MKDQEIIDAFMRLLMKTEYAKITVKLIAKEAGINRTYFYQFFDNFKCQIKLEILAAHQ